MLILITKARTPPPTATNTIFAAADDAIAAPTAIATAPTTPTTTTGPTSPTTSPWIEEAYHTFVFYFLE